MGGVSQTKGMGASMVDTHDSEARGRSGNVLSSKRCANNSTDENGKSRGLVSREEVQYLSAAPRGWLDGSTFGAFPDAVR